jgi:type II restriction/modification system DNA methylase subunit YeeA
LLATNSIRGGANRRVLARIRETGGIFFAEADRPWILNGASVRVSMVGFDNGTEMQKTLDNAPVDEIYADLTGVLDLTTSAKLAESDGIAFYGTVKIGPFDLEPCVAQEMLASTGNPNGRPNEDVVKPWVNAIDVTRRPRNMWATDFGVNMPLEDAALYEKPFEYLRMHVKPIRDQVRRKKYREVWWLFGEPGTSLRKALAPLSRYVATPAVAKHRLFVWMDRRVVPDHALTVFARDDDYFFGVLHSRAHELWALRMGTSLEDRPRYTPTTCFETFPFPEPMEEQRAEISAAAKRLDELRCNWLNPEGASEAELKKRTLTNLYNARPTWLANVHTRLDAAVYAAYGWSPDITDEEILKNLLALNLEQSKTSR